MIIAKVAGAYLVTSAFAPLLTLIPSFPSWLYLYAFPLAFYLDGSLSSLGFWLELVLGLVAYSVVFVVGEKLWKV